MGQKHQEKTNSRLIYGIHPILEALEAGKSVEKILIRRERGEHARIQDVRTLAKETDIPVQWVPEVKIERLSRGGNHQGVLAYLSPITFQSLDEVMLSLGQTEKIPLLIMLDRVTDVRNFGAIARTAVCMGADALIVPTQGAAAIGGDAIKTSAGALHHIPICRVHNLTDTFYILQTYGLQGVACTEKAENSLLELDMRTPTCLIFGAEDKGISSQLLKRVDHLAKIPVQGPINSLNVAVAVGMALMEVARQRSR